MASSSRSCSSRSYSFCSPCGRCADQAPEQSLTRASGDASTEHGSASKDPLAAHRRRFCGRHHGASHASIHRYENRNVAARVPTGCRYRYLHASRTHSAASPPGPPPPGRGFRCAGDYFRAARNVNGAQTVARSYLSRERWCAIPPPRAILVDRVVGNARRAAHGLAQAHGPPRCLTWAVAAARPATTTRPRATLPRAPATRAASSTPLVWKNVAQTGAGVLACKRIAGGARICGQDCGQTGAKHAARAGPDLRLVWCLEG